MIKTPLSERKHIGIFGDTNSGKSVFFNKLLGQNIAITSSEKGTTTDPIIKAMELIPYGAIALIDTAGFNDDSILGKERETKTIDIINRTDLALYLSDVNSFNQPNYEKIIKLFKEKNIPHILIFTKCDTISENGKKEYLKKYPDSCFVSREDDSIDKFKEILVKELEKLTINEDDSQIKDLVKEGGTVVLVTPIDSEAPKGRLILPQVMILRDCLDNNITCLVTKENTLADAIKKLSSIDLVITDSQVFKMVDEIVPKNIPLTSFSILLARKKGDLSIFTEGLKAIESLEDGDKILMAEACSHNLSHDDIGRVKIPNALKNKTKLNLNFDYYTGYDFPKNLEEYKLVIHCGGCMINDKAIQNRVIFCKDKNIPITNYGVLLAYSSGILNRSLEIFNKII